MTNERSPLPTILLAVSQVLGCAVPNGSGNLPVFPNPPAPPILSPPGGPNTPHVSRARTT